MKGTELEGGVACAYMDSDRKIDIDEALSYIDERIQDVLGHYRKDFEGGFTPKTLGARFGDYGSFLPTYRRPPSIWSTPRKVKNHSTQVSSHDLEGAHRNSKAPLNVTYSLKSILASNSPTPPPSVFRTTVDGGNKAQSSSEYSDRLYKLPINQSDQKTLKVVKIDSDNGILAKKNAALYSSLGLEVSLSLSSGDTPECHGNSLDSQENEGESPSCILSIMTPFPISSGVLLSPLPGSLAHFMEDRGPLISSKSGSFQKSSSISADEVASVKGSKKSPKEKTRKSGNKHGRLVELKNYGKASEASGGGVKEPQPYSPRNIKKSKGRQDCGSPAAQSSKESLRPCLFAATKDKITNGISFLSKSKGDDKLQKDIWKAKVSNHDMIGMRKVRETEGRSGLLRDPVRDQVRNKRLEFPKKGSHASDGSKETSDGRKSFPSVSGIQLNVDLNNTMPLTGPSAGVIAPVVIEENWVYCDKCHKWRLLPYDTNLDQLPKKWLCSMLNWLPGMNHCSFSEEDTTNALYAIYQIPVAETHNNQQHFPGGTAAGVTLIDNQHIDQTPQDLSFTAMPSGGKKKLEKKKVSNAAELSDSMEPLNSILRKQQVSFESKNRNLSSLETKSEKRYGDTTPLSMKRETDRDGFRLPKKAKTKTTHYDDNQNVDGLSKKKIEINDQKYNDISSSKDSRAVAKDSSIVSAKNSKNQAQMATVTEDHDKSYIAEKRRKLKDGQDSQIYRENLPSCRHYIKDNRNAVEEEKHGSECRKEKKPRESGFLGKESNTSEADGEPKIEGKMTGLLPPSCGTNSINGNNLYKEGKGTLKDGSPAQAKRSHLGRINISVSYKQKEDFSHKLEMKNEAPSKKEIKVGNHGYKDEKNYVGEKTTSVKCPCNVDRKKNQFTYEEFKDSQSKSNNFHRKDGKSTAMQNILLNDTGRRSLKWLPPGRTDEVEVAAGRDKSLNSPLLGDKQENLSRYSQSVFDHGEAGKYGVLLVDGWNSCDFFKAKHQLSKDDSQNGLHHVSSRHPAPELNEARDAPNNIYNFTIGRETNNSVKEAKDLKHSGDHYKISGSGLQSTELFFQSALKSLHGASLLDPHNTETARYREITSTEAYSSSAKLCKYCAREYERCKDMASAALAYKCMEVAYMQIVYCNDFIANKGRNELQMALQMVSQDESPSSSSSDVENLNNEATMENMGIVKDVDSPHVSENHVIDARNRLNHVLLLNFAQDINFAMEASRKSQIAFEAANVVLPARGLSAIKRVLDTSFHDVEGLLRLVRIAMETLSLMKY